jgi:DNA-binding CsgD family transcriptional regulator/GAF domain-containing protein
MGDFHEREIAAIEAIYDAAPVPARWSAALQSIAECFGDFGANLFWARDDGRVGIVVSPSLEVSGADYARNWADRDIRAVRFNERLYHVRGDAVTDRDLTSNEEVETHPFYTEFLARYGLKWLGAIAISPDPRVIVGLSIQRLRTKPPFSEEEMKVLTRLGRHAEKSLRLSIRLFEAELVNVSLGDALSRIDIGVFVLDMLGRVVFTNRAGQCLLGDGLDIVDQRLRTHAAVDAAIGQMLSRGAGRATLDPRPILVERTKSHRSLAIYVLPVGGHAVAAHEFLVHAHAIVLAIDPSSVGPPDPSVVRDVLGLTFGEARVAALIGSGLSPRETAEKLGIANETVRNVLKRVFSKVGVSRQNELAALLSKLVLH